MKYADLPGPKGLPLLGNALQLDNTTFHSILENWQAEYGNFYKFDIFNWPFVVISDPEISQKVLRQRPETYCRIETLEPVAKEINVNGVFTGEGDFWKRQRKLSNEALDGKHMRMYFPLLQKITQRLHDVWSQPENLNTPLDVHKYMTGFTVDVTTNLVFGYDMNTLETEEDIQEDLDRMMSACNSRVLAPFPYWRYFKLPKDRALDRSLEKISALSKKMIENCQRNLDPDAEKSNLLEKMLLARDDENNQFSEEEIYGNMVNMLLVGEDTTADMVSWTINFLAENEHVQERLQREVDAVLSDEQFITSMEQLKALDYIDAIAYETLRLKPVTPIIGLHSNVDTEIEGVEIKARTGVTILARPAGLIAENFPEPTAFKPERWYSDEGKLDIKDSQKFIPFGFGPRVCPGRNLSMIEAKLSLAMLARNFHVYKDSDTNEEITEYYTFTMHPKNMRIKFRKRETN